MDKIIGDVEILMEEQSCQTVKVSQESDTGKRKKMYIESYGCQMNFSDSEIVTSIMQSSGFDTTSDFEKADVIFLNTCSIREKAEHTIRNRLKQFIEVKNQRPETMIGVLGCMAERLKEKLLDQEKIVDLVAGPDAYRDLPNLVSAVEDGSRAVNTFLSREETYADISPVRLNSNGVTAFISIMRGCDNMCSFCVVPFTRGRERSRDPESIVKEARDLFAKGYREVTLLGQNVDSYHWEDSIDFAGLLEKVAQVDPNLRIRFSTSHPKDMTDKVLRMMTRYENICKYIHLPVQSGNSEVLHKMNRTYSREWYLDRIHSIRTIIGEDCGISSDMIAGFCGETADQHTDTLSLMEEVNYDFSYMFFYSERPGTLAAKKYKDDVPLEIKKERLSQIIELQREHSLQRNQLDVDKVFKVLIEGNSKRSGDQLMGRNSANKVVVFPKGSFQPGQYVQVRVNNCTAATLIGEVVDQRMAL